jgi:two-component system sensor histidine kinase HydH
MQNAIQAMDGRGRVTVSTAARRCEAPGGRAAERARGAETAPRLPAIARRSQPDEVGARRGLRQGHRPGISQKVLKNLFIPFFTTKEQGTGLGLAISQSIVQNAGGTIDVQSQPGAGTTFTIVLPSAGYILTTPDPRASRGARSSRPHSSEPKP